MLPQVQASVQPQLHSAGIPLTPHDAVRAACRVSWTEPRLVVTGAGCKAVERDYHRPITGLWHCHWNSSGKTHFLHVMYHLIPFQECEPAIDTLV